MKTQQNDRRRLSSSGLDGSQVTAQYRSQDEPRVVAAYQEDGGKMPEKKIINLKKNPKILQLMNKNRAAALRQGAQSAMAFQSSQQLQL